MKILFEEDENVETLWAEHGTLALAALLQRRKLFWLGAVRIGAVMASAAVLAYVRHAT